MHIFGKIKLKKIIVFFSGDNKGAVAVIVAICLFAIMVTTALAVDVGSLFEDRRHLQTVADAAALAGAQELPESPDEAEQKAIEYISFNYGEGVEIDIEIGSYLGVDYASITVTVLNPDSPLYFARVMNKESTPVGAKATAIVGSPKVLSGGMPWGVPKEDWEPGEPYVLKWGSGPLGKNFSGNFQPLSLESLDGKTSGGEVYKDNIIYGSASIEVGEMVDTLPGNKVGKTDEGVEGRIYGQNNFKKDAFLDLVELTAEGYKLKQPDSQFVMIPIISGLEETHGKSIKVEILGFAPFIITGYDDEMVDEEFGNGIAIVGTFLNEALIVTTGSINPVESGGIKVIRLIK